MANNGVICITAFLLAEINILQIEIFDLQIIKSLFLKAIICLYTTQLA